MNKRFILFAILLIIFGFYTVSGRVFATVSSCTASVSHSSVTTNSNTEFTFTVNNTSSETISWVKITRPSSNFTLGGFTSTGGWTTSTSVDNITLTNNTVLAGNSNSIRIEIFAGSSEAASANWTIQTSDDSGGASPTSCTGSLGTAISGAPTDTTAPEISSVAVSDVTSSTVKITWTTNENATSAVEYGITEDYGSTKSDSVLATSHSLTLDGLSANTTYYFAVKSLDSSNNEAIVEGNFVAAKASSTITTTVTTLVTPTPTPTPLPDTTKPTVTISTNFSKPFEAAPEIFAKATDNKGVSKAEYSIDNGKNWLPVSLSSSGRATYSFSFVPDVQDDGNYNLQVRATDSSSNIGYSKKHTLVIDRLSPQVSGILFSLGPQVINPRQDGSILTMAGQPLKITLSEVGGSTKAGILALNQTNKSPTTYSLTKNPDNGLWSGVLPLKEKGEYQLKFKALDGAGNKTETNLNKVVVVESGRISSVNGNVSNAKITVYYQEPRSKAWQIWDGGAYSQTNPQKTDKNGNYSLFLPAGKYYLQIESYGFQTQTSEFFTIEKPQPINADFSLKSLKLLLDLKIIKLYWPDFSTLTVPFRNNLPQVSSNKNQLIGKQMPFFSLADGFKSDSLTGKPGILTFLNTWSPSSTEQIPILNNFSKNNNFNSATIIEGEKSSKVFVFRKRGSYSLPMYTDPDATLVTTYNLNVLPTSYFVDRKGVIKDVVIGVLSQEEIEEKLLDISN